MRQVEALLPVLALRRPVAAIRRTGTPGQKTAHLLGFILFDRAGMRLLFGDAHRGQSIKDFLALYLEFSCEIVNANFVHPVLFVKLPLRA